METNLPQKQNQELQTSAQKLLPLYAIDRLPIIFKDVTSIELAIQSKAPTLAALRKNEGEGDVKVYLGQMLNKLNMDLNLNKPLSLSQITTTVEWIMIDYYALNLADINIIFKKAIKGEYGEFYESLRPDKILGWFQSYFNERVEIAASNALKQHYQNKDHYAKESGGSDAKQAYIENHRSVVSKFKEQPTKIQPNEKRGKK